MNEPAAGDRKISHFLVTVEAYDRVTALLGDMPFKYAAAPLQYLTEGSRVVYEPEAKIVDNPESDGECVHEFVADTRGDKFNGYVCRHCHMECSDEDDLTMHDWVREGHDSQFWICGRCGEEVNAIDTDPDGPRPPDGPCNSVVTLELDNNSEGEQ